MRQKFTLFLVSLLTVLALSGCSSDNGTTPSTPAIAAGTKASVALLETTDLHANILSYDYFKLAEDKSFGFERVATLITQVRQENPNNFLFDNGDTIQGTALSDYQALVKPVACSETLAQYKVMNAANYDGGTVGNHEFNYGLPYLSQVTGSILNVDVPGMPTTNCAGPKFPLVLANVNSVKTNAPLFDPYRIITKTISAVGQDGTTVNVPLKVGIIGFTPAAIVNWDKRWLDGKVYTVGAKEAAEKYIPEMRSKGADLVVALCHGGLDDSTYSATMENPCYYVAQVPGVDAMMTGHSHQLFPLDTVTTSLASMFKLPNVDAAKGTVFGVPTTMANFWGKDLGVIKLQLTHDGSKWAVDKSKTTVEARSIKNANGSYVTPDPTVAAAIKTENEATIAYVKTPIGTSDFAMNTYFADVGDPGAIEIVNQAQADYVSNYVKANLSQYASLPVLSVSAPFKSGFAGGSDYTDVAQGNVAINNAADLYLYPNTVYAVKVNGTDIKNWLETAAKRFNQIDPAKTTAQNLISTFAGYNFDMFTSKDISYEIDITQPDISKGGSRIRNLTYKGTPIANSQEFIIATNNYRASGGGNFPGIDGTKTIYASPDSNRDVLIAYIKNIKNITRTANGSDHSWKFTKVTTAGKVTFTSAIGKLAAAQAAGLTNVSVEQADDGSGKGLSLYAIDLSK